MGGSHDDHPTDGIVPADRLQRRRRLSAGPEPHPEAVAALDRIAIRNQRAEQRWQSWLHDNGVEADVALLGPHPEHPATADAWTTGTISVMHSAVWLNQRPANPSVTTRLSGTQLIARRRELRALLESAPHPLGPLLADLVSTGDASTAVPGASDTDRNNWILTNWPHVIELREVEGIIANVVPAAPDSIEQRRTLRRHPIPEQQLELDIER